MTHNNDPIVVVAITETRTRQMTFTRDAFLDYVMRVPQLDGFADELGLPIEDLARRSRRTSRRCLTTRAGSPTPSGATRGTPPLVSRGVPGDR